MISSGSSGFKGVSKNVIWKKFGAPKMVDLNKQVVAAISEIFSLICQSQELVALSLNIEMKIA